MSKLDYLLKNNMFNVPILVYEKWIYYYIRELQKYNYNNYFS